MVIALRTLTRTLLWWGAVLLLDEGIGPVQDKGA